VTPYSELICGQVWTPGREIPAKVRLSLTPVPPPPAPPRSDFPAPARAPYSEGAAFLFGDCVLGAIVTITPMDAAFVYEVFYATDGGVAFMTVTNKPGQSYLLRAWSGDGTYLGEYRAPLGST